MLHCVISPICDGRELFIPQDGGLIDAFLLQNIFYDHIKVGLAGILGFVFKLNHVVICSYA